MESTNGKPPSFTLPEKWVSENDYDSHRGLLYTALCNTTGTVVELGCGHGSTLLTREFCEKNRRKFVSLENNTEWGSKFGSHIVSENYNESTLFMPCDLLFVDSKPGEDRKHLIADHAHQATIIVVHDSEAGAEYVYGMANVLSTFKFRIDYKPEGKPGSTAVSNFIDVSKWIIPE